MHHAIRKGDCMKAGETLVYRAGRIVCWVTLVREHRSCRVGKTGNIESYEVEALASATVKRLKSGRG